MLNRTLEQRLSKKPPLRTDPVRIRRTVCLTKAAFHNRRPYDRVGFAAFCLRQAGFFLWQTWLLQAVLLVVAYLGLRLGQGADISPVLYVPFALRTSAVAAVLTVLPTLYRSARHRMFEVEIAARAGYARLLIGRLLLAGGGSVLLLSGVLAFAVLATDIDLLGALFCLLPPFLITLTALLLLLPRVPLRCLPWALYPLGAAMLIASASLGGKLPDTRLYPVWGIVCALLLMLCASQLCLLKEQGGFADAQFS